MSPRRPATRGTGSGFARRREARRRALLLTTGTLAILGAFALIYVAIKSPTGIPLKPYYNVSARFRSLGTLETGASVTVSGRQVGQVVDLRLVKGVATVDLQMNPGTRLPVGTTARIRPRGLLGAEYVDLTPSRATRAIPNGGTIPTADTSDAEQLSDVIAGLTPSARRNLQGMINGLGEGFLGRGAQLNQTLSTAPSTLANLTHALTPVLRTDATPTLISGANAVSADLDAVTYDFYPGLHYGAKSLEPLQAEASSVSRLLETAPSAVTSIDASLVRTDVVLGHLSRFAARATTFASLAPRALASLTSVLVDHKPLGSARTLLRKLQPAIAPTTSLTAALKPSLPEYSRLFTAVGPVLNTIAPYGCDILGFANNWRGFLGVGSNVQQGPLGPNTILRLVLASPVAQVATVSALPIQADTDPKPCVGTGGP